MTPALKIGTFTAALAVAFGAAYGIGEAVGPLSPDPAKEAAAHAEHSPAPSSGEAEANADTLPGGLQVSEDGYTLDLETPAVRAGQLSTLRFVVRGADGAPVTAYQTAHDKELHLIIASHR